MGENAVLSHTTTATLLDQLIAQQQELTAVGEFARAHERGEITQSRYRRLMPVGAPGPGQQLAFEVDLDRCTGCKACVTACHALNGLDDGEAWRQVGTLISEDWRRPFRQTVPTTCHHCVEPGCLTGCPVMAYEKDPVTGVVRHLDDQCIGCQYCIMMCPYEVPQYSTTRGIVRKCDMCSQRLAVGEAPACVQACPNEAIHITIVNRGALENIYRVEPTSVGEHRNRFLPTTPDPAITLPSTRFVSRRPLAADLAQGDNSENRAQPAHTPLVLMLVLTQLGAGGALFSMVLPEIVRWKLLLVSLVATGVGLGASVAHLGRPTKAWRSFLGLRTSWLSREIVAFGAFMTALAAASATRSSAAISVAAAFGFVGVLCSAFVYHATRRDFWMGVGSFGKFLSSALLLGAAVARCVDTSNHWLTALSVAGAFLKLAVERFASGGAEAATERFAILVRLRFLCAGGAISACLGGFVVAHAALALSVTALALFLIGEVLERMLFFRAVSPPRMPAFA